MRLAMTLLCRNESDIIASTMRFHLDRGIDVMIVTDNGSTDGTKEILKSFAADSRVKILHEPSLTHNQGAWVTRMAHLATHEYNADWLIHSDADEYWWADCTNLKDQLTRLPEDIEALAVQRYNFIPLRVDDYPEAPFHQVLTIREQSSLNSLGQPLPPKICHRAKPLAEVEDGNHGVRVAGRTLTMTPTSDLEILHFPIRSYSQFEAKIREGTEALERNHHISPEVGRTWRYLYHEHLVNGSLPDYYRNLIPDQTALENDLDRGVLIRDERIKSALAEDG